MGKPWGRILSQHSSNLEMFFRSRFWSPLRKAKWSTKKPKKANFSAFLARPGGMCGARGRDREGEIRRSRTRLLKLSNLRLEDICPRLGFKIYHAASHLRWGGGTLRAFRRAGDEVARDNLAGNRWADLIRQKTSLDMKSIVLVPKR